MNPTGKVERVGDGSDLVVLRTFKAPIDDVWASVTEPDRTARWLGRWEGEGAPGRTVRVQLGFEEGAPWSDFRIDVCEPPRRLAVSTHEGWDLELLLAERDGATELRLVHHLGPGDNPGEVGPGWEYYLDLLVAYREGGPTPDFADYYPAMAEHFTAQVAR